MINDLRISITVGQVIKQTVLPPIESQILLAHVLKKDRAFMLAHPEFKLNQNQESKIQNLIQRRLKNEPLAYILSEKEFYGFVFKVTPDTLIPRPETEEIIELTSQFLKDRNLLKPIIYEIGTGSGAIGIILAKKFPEAIISASDISKPALKVANQNAKSLGVKNIEFILGNLLEPMTTSSFRQVQCNRNQIEKKDSGVTVVPLNDKTDNDKLKPDIIVANLPYISRHIYEKLEPQIRDFEPEIALVGGETGMELYEKLFEQIDQFFPGTTVLYEVDGRIYQKN